jgi:hypothetical protein
MYDKITRDIQQTYLSNCYFIYAYAVLWFLYQRLIYNHLITRARFLEVNCRHGVG